MNREKILQLAQPHLTYAGASVATIRSEDDIVAFAESIVNAIRDELSKEEPIAWAMKSTISNMVNGVTLSSDCELKTQILLPLIFRPDMDKLTKFGEHFTFTSEAKKFASHFRPRTQP